MAFASHATRRMVTKRDGSKEPVDFSKIQARIVKLCGDLPNVDPTDVGIKVVDGLIDGVTTTALDELAVETAQALTSVHPEYSQLAGRLAASILHKTVPASFAAVVAAASAGEGAVINPDFAAWVAAHGDALDAMLHHERDFDRDLFAIRTLEKSYLLRARSTDGTVGPVLERPQHMLMRVAVFLCQPDVEAVHTTYTLLSKGIYTHATPTLFNAGTLRPQLASCFLLGVDDSISGIFKTLKTVAKLSKHAGGIGMAVHNIRAKGSYIRGTNGTSNGTVPMLRVFNDAVRYVDQGGGKRKGACAIYMEPWHADVLDFLALKRPTGAEELRARDLFYALWIDDLFMRRVEANEPWSLFCPTDVPGLTDAFGPAFDDLYTRYEAEGRARRVVPARAVWDAAIASIQESGVPYMMSKTAANTHNNQAHCGTLRQSNLCAEIMQYSDANTVAVCNLASLSLGEFVMGWPPAPTDGSTGAAPAPAPYFDFDALQAVVRVAITNLDAAIDRTFYAVKSARESNLRERPVGLGVQGLADVFYKLRLPFGCPESRALNIAIFEAIYYAALNTSCDLAAAKGAYPNWSKSPAAAGRLQVDMWGVATPDGPGRDWTGLRARIATHGLRNSMLTALMPTASTAQILGNTEAFEPALSNLFVRRVLSGEFAVVNRYLVRDLMATGLWDADMRNALVASRGSVAAIKCVPEELKRLYVTAWELSMRVVIDMAADRAPYIDQSQSMNLFVEDPTPAVLTGMLFHAWRRGLKTLSYYIRGRPKANAVAFTVDAKRAAAFAAGATPSLAAETVAAAPTAAVPTACARRRPGAPSPSDEDGPCDACSA
jgi:ribonucleoside-diphosphate reductase alpha chain